MSAVVRQSPRLSIGGVDRLSMVDWPGQLCAVVFTQGCAWNCPYCHNPHLIPFKKRSPMAWSRVRDWLERRRGLLDGVVFSGGEPTLQDGLGGAMREVRDLGFAVALHTGGPRPDTLASLTDRLDWVGFDFKAPFERYAFITGRDQGESARESLRLLLDAGIALEVRTTWHPALLSPADLLTMGQSLLELGVQEWTLQRFRAQGCLSKELCAHPPAEPALDPLRELGLRVELR